MIEFGHFIAFVALATAMGQTYWGFTGDRRRSTQSAIVAFGATAVAFLTLILAFLRSDFSVALVANNSHTLKPWIYKLAGTWGNHEGSMLLWCLVTAGFGALGAYKLKTGRDVFESRAIGIQGFILTGALAYLLFASNPFLRIEKPPLEGASLNPLLQDPALALHPPFLYLGYVGYSFVFALAASALIDGRADRLWASVTRKWAMPAFILLTIGIAMGSYWAYYELGWGGWWFWDPVENASFMPWLIGAALLHSLVVTEKRGAFAGWSVLLAVLAFCFSILGAFLVRSGVLTSVHAFAIDPLRGSLLLIGLGIFGGSALLLYAIRAGKIQGGQDWYFASREGGIAVNNVVLIVATLTILLGTLFPLIGEAVDSPVSVGEPYFHLTFVPIMALALLVLPVVQDWNWGKVSRLRLSRRLWVVLGCSVFVGVSSIILYSASWLSAFGLILGIWLILGSLSEFHRRAVRWSKVFRLSLRVWGMTVAHAGIGVFILGAVVESSWRVEETVTLDVGEQRKFADWTLTLDKVESIEGPNWYAQQATITAQKGANLSRVLKPQRRFYPAAQMPTTETAILKRPIGDIYIALGDFRDTSTGGYYVFRTYFNPFIGLVFLGAGLIATGGLLSLVGSFKRSKATI